MTPQAPDPNKQRKGEETAQRLLDAALSLFVERGFGDTSVPQLGSRAGVSTGLLYYHFANKEALANALYQHRRAQLAHALAAAVAPDLPYRARFAAAFAALRAFALAHPDAYSYLELHHHSYLDQASLEAERAARAPLCALLSEGAALSLIKPHPPELLAAVLLGVFTAAWRADQLDEARAGAVEQMAWEALRA